MYNPPAPDLAEVAAGFTDNDDFEFIELFNRGATPLPLAGYEITRGVTFEFPDENLAAGERAVIVSNAAAFRLRYGNSLRVMGEYDSGQLANDGETLAIRDPSGREILTVEYDDSALWPQAADGIGASLELVDPQGSLVEHLSKPVLWQNSTRFLGSPAVEDVSRPAIVINEVLSASSNDDSMDRIELQNTSSSVVDLSGWYLSDSARNPRKFRIPDGVQLEPGQFVVFDETDFNPNPLESQPTDFALSRTGDDVWLSILGENSDRDRTFVDDVHFPAAVESVPFGACQTVMVDSFPCEPKRSAAPMQIICPVRSSSPN